MKQQLNAEARAATRTRGGSAFALAGSLLLASGCGTLLPESHTTVESRWKSYTEVKEVFDRVEPYQSTAADLKELGLTPEASPNIKVLTYVEIIQRFMPNPAITQADLDEPVRDCINAKQDSYAYELTLTDTHAKRHGSVFLDVFGFKRQTHETGWKFHGLILFTNDLVIYKLNSGEPQFAREQKQVRPLGPLQELDSAVVSAAKSFK